MDDFTVNEPISEYREGFKLRAIKLIPPGERSALDPKIQRSLMICDLFLNEKLTISEIVGVLDDEDYRSVISALLDQGVIRDRRQQQKPCSTERRKSLP